jgi:hypothetical protein
VGAKMNTWFTFNLVVIQGDYIKLMWVYFIYFAVGEIAIYTVEKLAGIDTMVRWYDLVWLLFVMFIFGLNSYKLFIILASDAQ